MTVVLAAHGTRNPHGVELLGELAQAISARLADAVHLSFVDVLGPSPSEVLAALPAGPVTVLPAFLSRGYHVRVDIPAHLERANRPIRLAEALGPSRLLVTALQGRLAEAGATRNAAVVLAAAGSSDPAAHRDIEVVASGLSHQIDAPVRVAFASVVPGSAYPSVADTVAELREDRGVRRVAVASYLLADGLFQQRLAASGADIVARPLGLTAPVIELACARIASATSWKLTDPDRRLIDIPA
ncbi:sirohydrochlorin chelatase [Gordonia sp. (in: high G+C Gram-positive bacteria)]|uniref:sirohydrochlorin chelatase n=1 Tax=Gordonia sp. (in: high G+C Gram-positive bacteria) TaxID=84139 RepID=UPI003C745F1E